jgi:adenine-specific DNA-methyltransferase
MTYEQIHNLFKQRYNQSNWKQFLGEAFANTRLLTKPEILTGIDSNVASQVQKLGYITLNENGIERQIAVYEVTLAQGIILERNRVGLRNLLRKYWKDIDAAFIAYHRPETPNWRFTYVSELTGYDADGEFVKIKTEPKRYTYVLGEGESTRTAAERFTTIASKRSKATLDDVKEAFSVEKLSKAFFDEYKKHYDIFCDFMVSKPNIRQTIFNGDEKGIRDFNKKLLGRIVFLYFIQKKGWLGVPAKSDWGKGDFDFLTNLFMNTKNPDLFYSELLSKLFFDTLNTKRKDDLIELVKGEPCRIPYLNGGLFEEDDKKHRNLIFPANLFKSLFDFFNQYNFTIYEDDPNDHTVAVDPEMLGHIFENLLEDNKDKGAYYTPKEIVHYMCQESLIEYLTTWFENKGYEVVGYIGFDKPDQPKLFSANEGRKGQLVIETDTKSTGKQIDRLLIEKLLKKKLDDDDKKLIKKHSAEFHIALDSVKICDPAIGSGAFPMGLLHEIFTAKQTLHTFEHGNTKTFDASGVKLNIIQNSIYGVDIEKGAVDIARLRFWLSLIVDEEKPKALPNLDYKIVVGNSLVSKLGDDIIDIDWEVRATSDSAKKLQTEIQKNLNKIFDTQKIYFNYEGDKDKLQKEIRNLKIDLLISQLNLDKYKYGEKNAANGSLFELTAKEKTADTERKLKIAGYDKTIRELQKLKDKPDAPLHFFDWKLDFPEVMNGQVITNVGFDIVIGNPPYVNIEKIDQSIKDNIFKFKTAYQKYDLYVLFYEVGLNLLKGKGILSFITSNKFLSQGYGLKLRQEFLLHRIDQIVNFNYDIFESATVRTCIIQVSKTSPPVTHNIEVIDVNTIKDRENFTNRIVVDVPQKTFDETEDNNFRINLTKEKITLVKKIKNSTLPLYEICSVNYGLRPVSKIPNNDKYSFIKSEYKKGYKKYFEVKDTGIWLVNEYCYLDYKKDEIYNPMFEELFENAKLVGLCTLSEINKLRFIYDNEGLYCNHSVGILTLWHYFKNVKNVTINRTISKEKIANSKNYSYQYLQAILNSKIIKFYVNELMYDGTHFYPNHMKVLPIKITEIGNQKSLGKIVDKIHSIKNKNKETDTTALEQELDSLVYKLYELTYDEVKVIDPEFSLSKKEYESIELE